MALVPRVDAGGRKQPVGVSTGSASITNWHYDALLVSHGHRRNKKTGSYVGVGPLYVWKRSVTFGRPTRFTYSVAGGALKGTYTLCGSTGPPTVMPSNISSQAPTYGDIANVLSGHYATGYARARPGNPVASLGQFLIELRDVPAHPLKSFFVKGRGRRLRTAIPFSEIPRALANRAQEFLDLSRKIGSEYLNIQFGWRPFIGDLRKMYYLWQDVDRRMAQIIRENNKTIRRRATIETSSTLEMGKTVGSLQTVTEGSNARASDPSWGTTYAFPFANTFGNPPNFGWTGTTTYSVMRTRTEKVWFSGHFRYSIPDTSSSQWNRHARLALFGAIPTPELIWEIIPWSWLIDWFTNVGDVISNFSPNAVGYSALVDSCVMRSVIETTIYSSNTIVNKPAGSSFWTSGEFNHSSTDKIEIKTRTGTGNPFGLNVQLPSLSTFQLSILAALGISRGKVK